MQPVYSFPQIVTACFAVEGLGMDVTVENLPFDWQPSHGARDDSGSAAAAKWLFENAPECRGKAMTLIWVNCAPRRDVEGAAA